jgi:hypothetical protein
MGSDQRQWDEIVDAFADVVWSVARAHTGSGSSAAQVSALTWRRLGDHVDVIPPDAIGDWLRQTAERESLRARALSHG